jgi:ferritin-like protein
MRKKSKNEHPEVKDIKNICEVTPKDPQTKSICEKINQDKPKNKR